jgi:hypothetical protein
MPKAKAVVVNSTIEGSYAIRFSGFNREGTAQRARHIVGVGTLILQAGKVGGTHRSTNIPMTGTTDQDSSHVPPDDPKHVRHTVYKLDGTYSVENDGTDGNPIELEVKMKFKKNNTLQMTDTFRAVQHGLDRFWLISTDPQDDTGTKKVDELVMAEAVRRGDDW